MHGRFSITGGVRPDCSPKSMAMVASYPSIRFSEENWEFY